jgi:hypothetical protein
MQRRGFFQRGGGPRWKADRPYHVAFEDSYIRAHWDEINALCRLNGIPFSATGERIQSGGMWCVYEFSWQLDAMQFWNQFEGRWLLGSEFHYAERPMNLARRNGSPNETFLLLRWRSEHAISAFCQCGASCLPGSLICSKPHGNAARASGLPKRREEVLSAATR